MRSNVNCFVALSLAIVLAKYIDAATSVAPILEIEDESKGYVGIIGEHNILVELKPQLQIKNILEINGICSYHVFKPNTEEFPFTIDIKDKTTGEAIIEVIRKELEAYNAKVDVRSAPAESEPTTSHIFNAINSAARIIPAKSDPRFKAIVLDCNKNKEFNFLIQAHDCSSPVTLASRKIPVKIQVIDQDDFTLKFDQTEPYRKTLVATETGLNQNFLTVKARDFDCTNQGFACEYKLVTNDESEREFLPFNIDRATGSLSSVRTLKAGELFDFKVRAFDCVSKDFYVEAQVIVKVVEPCIPQFFDYASDVTPVGTDHTGLFETLKTTECAPNQDEQNQCDITSVSSVVKLNMDESIKMDCLVEKEKCSDAPFDQILTKPEEKQTRLVLFSANTNDLANKDDDSIEEELNTDFNKVIEVGDMNVQSLPLSYRSFSKQLDNSVKIESFDAKSAFGSEFTLGAWLKRKPDADRSIKEQVLCGTDSQSMNRHHFGLYFYRGSVKFLLRKEHGQTVGGATADEFYPSLWEWSLSEELLTDGKWHFYQVKFNYPNAALYIDGDQKFAENKNTDIIDAYELSEAKDAGEIATYVGACYHARTKTLLDHFEGDIGSVVVTIKKTENILKVAPIVKCKKACLEYIEMNMVGNENYIGSIEKTKSPYEIKIKTSTLIDTTQLLRKLTYVNTETLFAKQGERRIVVTNLVKCSNGKAIVLKDLNVQVKLQTPRQEYNVQLEEVKQIYASTFQLENGIEVFKDFSILSIPINKIDANVLHNEPVIDYQEEDSIKLSKCLIKMRPERNLMDNQLTNSEKLMFLQNLLDDFGLSFDETIDSVTISGLQTVGNYQTFIRRLAYVITNVNEVSKDKLALIQNKKFFVSCFRSQPQIETNTVLIQLNLTRDIAVVSSEGSVEAMSVNGQVEDGFIALKQSQKLVVHDDDSDILQRKIGDYANSNKKVAASPATIAVVVMCSCAVGFMLVFGAIKTYLSRSGGVGKRKGFPNEENPQLEWDDSGLNITENPLDNLEICNKTQGSLKNQFDDDDEYSSSEEYADSNDSNDSNDDDDGDEDDATGGALAQGHMSYHSGLNQEEPEKIVDRELEWDDTSLEIKIRDKQLQKEKLEREELIQITKHKLSNKRTAQVNYADSNNC